MSRKSGLRHLAPMGNVMVYGPVRSRRLGYSLGINVNLGMVKICTFDCAYCQYGPTLDLVSSPDEFVDWPDEETLLEEVDKWLQRLSAMNQRLDSITFSGFGEPTLYPRLKEAILDVNKLRNKYYSGVEVDILTNASLIKNKETFEALKEIDSVVAKLDAGRQETFEDVNRPAAAVSSLDEVVESLRRLQHETGKVKLQTLIFKSADPESRDNSSPEEIKLIAEKARVINPVEIQVYTVSRYPSDAFVTPIDEHSLREVTYAINRIMGKECAKTYI